MPDHELLEIIKLCIALDITAYKTYLSISQATVDSELKLFWTDMAAEEKEHAHYWTSALKLAEEDKIPQLFDNPPKIREELRAIQDKIEGLLRSKIDPLNVTDTFLLAYRMEFFMNHHAFETLLEFVNSMDMKTNIERYYEEHINKFVDALSRFGASAPSLEVLGESLKRLWMENKTLSAQNGLDELTGIRNRRGFLDIIGKFGSLARRNRFSIGIMMADIDHFKNVNDTHGHVKGDGVLRKVAQVIQSSLRPSDVVGRYGGEEFVIYMSQIDPHAAFQVGEKIRQAVEQERTQGIGVTISVGICCGTFAMHDDIAEGLSDYISKADACLYEAKNTGRNKVVVTAPRRIEAVSAAGPVSQECREKR